MPTVCYTPAAFWTTTLSQLVQLSLTFAGTYLACWLGLKLIGFMSELGEAVIERVRTKANRNTTAATNDDPTPPTPETACRATHSA
ncbi:hypothetical protein ACFVYA_31095 [Amycolatopsis sp. NPDC058278]|uniref:hypothetical protein n=1 Tax=Amycolatopsis sp. NPDC058278 TaxID=3346417 RepID=UPI0036DE04F3